MIIEGRVWKFGSNIDTDAIIAARYLNVSDPEELAKHCMEDERPQFVEAAKKGDIIVAGSNFGCGSSREHAPIAIKAKGVSCVIAKSFARIFYRNAFNIGLPILESEAAFEVFSDGDRVSVDLSSGKLSDLNRSKRCYANPIPEFMREIIHAGGLVEYVMKKRLATS
jgi:3-isopropylmalate dehydratase small subunit